MSNEKRVAVFNTLFSVLVLTTMAYCGAVLLNALGGV